MSLPHHRREAQAPKVTNVFATIIVISIITCALWGALACFTSIKFAGICFAVVSIFGLIVIMLAMKNAKTIRDDSEDVTNN